jgi:NTP pyrophosphatase (non-canonical NTP hydrolase)
METLEDLRLRLRRFAADRDWDQFHTPKNLAMALAGEAGELVAEFQWLTPDQSATVMSNPTSAAGVRGELADVFIYLTRLADVLDVDLLSAAESKIETNETRFPIASYRSSTTGKPERG